MYKIRQLMALRLFFYTMLACLLAGCASSKDILYFQNIDKNIPLDTVKYTEVGIRKGDILSIIVSAPDKEVVMPYNFMIAEFGSSLSNLDRSIVNYQVSSVGEIVFPILGVIKVEGMTSVELEKYLTKEIGKDVKNPIVSVSFVNFRITVLGEVRTPGTYTITSEKINILQALGIAGDLLISAKRDDIILIREVDGIQTHVRIDIRSDEILKSPYFYLQQNDVLIVSPSMSRALQGRTATGIWSVVLSTVSVLATIAMFIITRN